MAVSVAEVHALEARIARLHRAAVECRELAQQAASALSRGRMPIVEERLDAIVDDLTRAINSPQEG